MNLTVEKEKVLSAAKKYAEGKTILEELFPDAFRKKEFNEILSFLDACDELEIDSDKVYHKDDTKDERAFKCLKVIVKVVNQGWTPDWNDTNQKKWYPWFRMSSGFGFVGSVYDYSIANSGVGSRLCFESKEKSDFVATQFIELYKDLLT